MWFYFLSEVYIRRVYRKMLVAESRYLGLRFDFMPYFILHSLRKLFGESNINFLSFLLVFVCLVSMECLGQWMNAPLLPTLMVAKCSLIVNLVSPVKFFRVWRWLVYVVKEWGLQSVILNWQSQWWMECFLRCLRFLDILHGGGKIVLHTSLFVAHQG